MRLRFTALALVATIAAAQAQEQSLVQAFETICVDGAGETEVVTAYADSIGAVAEAEPDLLGMQPPLLEATAVQRWLKGDPAAKAETDQLLVTAIGTAMDMPATGCMVLGYGVPGLAEQARSLFADAQPIGKSKSTIMPPYEYWLVETQSGPAIFAAAEVNAWDAGPTGLFLSLVRVDPTLVERLRQGL